MKYAAILLPCAIVAVLSAQQSWAQDRGAASPHASASAASKSFVPLSSKSSGALVPRAPRRGSLTKRHIPPPPPHRVRPRLGLAGQSRSSALFGPDPSGRIDQSGKPVEFYPSARSLSSMKHQKSATKTFDLMKPAQAPSAYPYANGLSGGMGGIGRVRLILTPSDVEAGSIPVDFNDVCLR